MKPRRKRGARAEAASPDGMRIDYVPLDEVARWPANPKRHDEAGIADSIDRFGYVAPLLLDETSGRIVAGHGRLDALQARQAAGGAPPGRVRVDARGRWLVPVVRGLSFASEDEADAYLIADNALSERGGWDHAALLARVRALAAGAGLRGTGYDDEAVRELAAKVAALTPKPAPGDDDVPEPPAEPVSRRGDMWVLDSGKGHGHRLLAGDSTVAADVARVMAGERAVLLATDPPYGVAYANADRPITWTNKDGPGHRVAKKDVANDGLTDGPTMQAFLESMLRAAHNTMTETAAYYFWHPMLTQGTYVAAAAAAGILIHRQIIWVKPVLLLGRGDYHWRHELCFYGWRQGSRCPFYGPRNQDTIWEVGSVTPTERKEMGHATPKPVALWQKPIENHTRPGEVCYEPFSGSFSQGIAGEMLGRKVYAIEVAAQYVDCGVERWQRFTGKQATLDGDGRTFAEVATARRGGDDAPPDPPK